MKRILAILLTVGLAQNAFTQDSTTQKLDALLQAYSKQDKFNGSVLVARQGKILLDKGYGFKNQQDSTLNDPHTIFQIASVTKQFTSTVILKLVELKKLTLTDKLSKFYPGYLHGDSITIEHLLTHTSGIYDYTHDGKFLYTNAAKPASEEKMMALFRDKELDFAPGTGWQYSNSGYSLLGYIIQKVTGMSYEKAVREYIFTPLQMNSSGFDFAHLVNSEKAIGYYSDSTEPPAKRAPIVDSSVSFAAGAIYSTVEDLYKWHHGLQQYKIINKSLLQKAYTPFKNKYGYGWIIDSLYGKPLISHSGGIFGFRSNIARIPEDDVCVILLNNTEVPGLEAITKKIFAVIYGKLYSLPLKLEAVPVPSAILNRYTGAYKIESNGLVIDIVLENGRLMAKPQKGPVSELLALDETHFFLSNEQEFRISFETDETGKIDKMVLDQSWQVRIAKKIK